MRHRPGFTWSSSYDLEPFIFPSGLCTHIVKNYIDYLFHVNINCSFQWSSPLADRVLKCLSAEIFTELFDDSSIDSCIVVVFISPWVFPQLSSVCFTSKTWCCIGKKVRGSEIQQFCYRTDCEFEGLWERGNWLQPFLKLGFKRGSVDIRNDSCNLLTPSLDRHRGGRGFGLGPLSFTFYVALSGASTGKERFKFKFHNLAKLCFRWHLLSIHAFADLKLATESSCLDVVSSKALNKIL